MGAQPASKASPEKSQIATNPAPTTTPAKTDVPLPAPVSSRRRGKLLGERELAVLRTSSFINGKIFQPWLDGEEERELFAFESLFTDPDGPLQLSRHQLDSDAAWLRPREYLAQYHGMAQRAPVMVESISPYLIKQDMVGDCSFVCSLCICAEFQRRFGHNLITGVIFPQSSEGMPIFNPSGKYLVRLFINGVARKVVIDDRLPVSITTGALLCARSINPLEMWVSMIEKAYMKLNGGYDFPGSNSGIDLYCLTGWYISNTFLKSD